VFSHANRGPTSSVSQRRGGTVVAAVRTRRVARLERWRRIVYSGSCLVWVSLGFWWVCSLFLFAIARLGVGGLKTVVGGVGCERTNERTNGKRVWVVWIAGRLFFFLGPRMSGRAGLLGLLCPVLCLICGWGLCGWQFIRRHGGMPLMLRSWCDWCDWCDWWGGGRSGVVPVKRVEQGCVCSQL
jgi:hypothetical protein